MDEIDANILHDDTKQSMKLPTSAYPDDAFKYLLYRIEAISKNLAIVTCTVKDGSGHPGVNLPIDGLTTIDGKTAVTNNSGIATGFSTAGSRKYSIKGYADIQDFETTKTIVAGSEYSFTFTITRRNFLLVQASTSLKFSVNCPTISYTLCGAGGSGGSSSNGSYGAPGSGGGGGYFAEIQNESVNSDTAYPVYIGGESYTDGGKTTFNSHTANGGSSGSTGHSVYDRSGGDGNGNGGMAGMGYNYPPTNGGNGSGNFYTSYTSTSSCGGGGGGGYHSGNGVGKHTSGGSPYGGEGGEYVYGTDGTTNRGKNGTGYGGGGGGAGQAADDSDGRSSPGGTGAKGAMGLRMHLIYT